MPSLRKEIPVSIDSTFPFLIRPTELFHQVQRTAITIPPSAQSAHSLKPADSDAKPNDEIMQCQGVLRKYTIESQEITICLISQFA